MSYFEFLLGGWRIFFFFFLEMRICFTSNRDRREIFFVFFASLVHGFFGWDCWINRAESLNESVVETLLY